jgi:hypothetical protein
MELIKILEKFSTFESLTLAVNFLDLYYNHKYFRRTLPEEMKEKVLKILTNDLLWDQKSQTYLKIKQTYNPITDFHWNGAANHLVSEFPDTIILVVQKILANYDKVGRYTPELNDSNLIIKGMKLYPEEIGKKILHDLGPPVDGKAYRLRFLFREIDDYQNNTKISILDYFKPETIWKWIDENIDIRAPYFASFIPTALFHSNNRICWAREILVKYGNNKNVRLELITNFMTFVFSGSITEYYNEVIKNIIKFKKNETNENVLLWVDEYIEHLQTPKKYGKIIEESI